MTTADYSIDITLPSDKSCAPGPSSSIGAKLADKPEIVRGSAWKQITLETLKDALILAVDDDPVVLESLQAQLASANYRNVVTTVESQTAFTLIKDKHPDIVLLDIKMPTGGLELLKMMRETEELARIPVIVLTSDSDPTTKLEALELGANDFLTKPFDMAELLTRVKNNLVFKSQFDQLAEYSLQLERDVFVDSLTALANRRAFEIDLRNRLRKWSLGGEAFALYLVDIDHFKKVNDCYGHRAGDKILRDMSKVVQRHAEPDGFACRYGGEEFAILKPVPDAATAQAWAESIRQDIANSVFVFEELQLVLTVSLGVTTTFDRDNSDMLLQRADSALYASKQTGRNRVHFHDGHSCVSTQTVSNTIDEVDSDHVATVNPTEDQLSDAKIMIVDDEPVMLMVIEKHLKNAGYHNFVTTQDSTTAVATMRQEHPDLVLLDVRMPQIGGLEILATVRNIEQLSHIPVIILTSSTDAETKSKALAANANDFLAKPVDVSELLSRVRTNLVVKAQHDRLAKYSEHLEFEINCRTSELFASRNEAIHCLASAAECRDDQTGHHTFRVGRYSALIVRELGIPEEQLPCIESAAQLHDVGKIGIPDAILKKRGPLTNDERSLMQHHAEIGERILRDCRSPVMRMAATIAVTHHEKWDGSGYPNGVAGEDIPLEGRITAVADVFDALSSRRHYKDAYALDECFAVLIEGRGSHFDPQVIDAFMKCKPEIIQLYHDYGDCQTD